MIPKQRPGSVREVWAPKVRAIQELQANAWAHPVRKTVLFSSTAALLGPAGQANYAAANSALNALSHLQQASGERHLPVILHAGNSAVRVSKSAAMNP